jgi:glycosyltransferase involved in cell wall biosynthesis
VIYLANSSKQAIGGGWSWISNIRKALPELVTDNYDAAKVYLIPSPTMVSREELNAAWDAGKKIVLRIDNAVRNSRNRNTGMPRMKDFADKADLIIYQSEWARSYLEPFVGNHKKTTVILNSVDETIFNAEGRQSQPYQSYGYARYNRDETKNWEMARYLYSMEFLKNPNISLNIVGQFSPELIEGNFDFYMNERYRFWGVQEARAMADIYRLTDTMIIPYYNDACSNTLIESLLCGCKLLHNDMLKTGGTPEILKAFREAGPSYFHLKRMAGQYAEAIEGVL